MFGALMRVFAGLASTWGRVAVAFRRRSNRPPRIAVVSHAVPPAWSGQAMVLARLFTQIPADRLVVITKASTPAAAGVGGWHHLPAEPWESGWLKRGAWSDVTVALRVVIRGIRIARLARRAGCDVIVACTGDLIDLPASAIACRLLRLPLVVYSFDDYPGQWRFSAEAERRARLLEPIVMGSAREAIVPNEAAARQISDRWPGSVRIVRNPAWGPPALAPAPPTADCTILYTGAVYHVNEQAFRILITGIDLAAEVGPQLVIHTAQDRDAIAAAGVAGPRVRVEPHVDPGQASDLQRSAAILFLGFAFDSSVPEIVRTSAPGKLSDYLASGVPILALAPADSFLAEYLTAHRCGLVVTGPEPAAVADAIRRLRRDEALRRSLVENALHEARRGFTAERAAAGFLAAVDDAVAAG